MNKIPVGKTISYAYSFTFGHIGAIIGLIWLPLILMAVLRFLPHLAGSGMDSTDQSPLVQGSQAIGNLAASALTLLLYAVMYVAVTRQALGLRQGTASVHFALGMPEFRVFGALLLVVMVMLAFLGTLAGAVAVLAQVAGNAAPLAMLAIGVAVAGALAFVYVSTRLWFLVVPVTVIEERINLGRGWTLTESNFWRAFAVILAVSLPIVIISVIGSAIIMGGDLAAPVPAATAKNPILSLMLFVQIADRHLPATLFLDLILAPFNLGLSLSAAAFAYRALVQDAAAVRAA
jgi:hypothetical protein